MEVKEAARTAKKYVNDLFAGENIINVGIEEVKFDEWSNEWKITVGFYRPWTIKDHTNLLNIGYEAKRTERSYKVVSINDENGKVGSLEDRFLIDSRVD